MKRLMNLALALLLVLTLIVPVFADVLYIPEDPFLEDYMDESQRMDRSYRALTEVTVYESPESAKEMGTLPTGESVFIYYVFTDEGGNDWGYCERYTPETYDLAFSGWLPMAYMELVYDYISFNEDYGHTFQSLDKVGQLPEEYRDDVVMFWNYPGSETGDSFDMAAWGGDYLPEYDTVYQDNQGRSWGYVGYYYGRKHFWICLDDPTADFETLYPTGAPEVEITEPDETAPTLPAEEIVPQPSSGMKLLRTGITVAVVVCIGVTVVLLVKMKKKDT